MFVPVIRYKEMKNNRTTKSQWRKGDVTIIAEATGYSHALVSKVKDGKRFNKIIEDAISELNKSRNALKKFNRKNNIA